MSDSHDAVGEIVAEVEADPSFCFYMDLPAPDDDITKAPCVSFRRLCKLFQKSEDDEYECFKDLSELMIHDILNIFRGSLHAFDLVASDIAVNRSAKLTHFEGSFARPCAASLYDYVDGRNKGWCRQVLTDLSRDLSNRINRQIPETLPVSKNEITFMYDALFNANTVFISQYVVRYIIKPVDEESFVRIPSIFGKFNGSASRLVWSEYLLALYMGFHKRLGDRCLFRLLDVNLLRTIESSLSTPVLPFNACFTLHHDEDGALLHKNFEGLIYADHDACAL